MELKPNNPLLLLFALLLIGGAIYYLESMKSQSSTTGSSLLEKEGLYPKAPELQGIKGYFNTPEGTTLKDFNGKVVIIDFWTYSCINCIRTIPYLNAWHDKYSSKGLVIVGVHSPEFEFEKDPGNVQRAIEKFGIKYAVVQDNDFATWRAYGNRFWPHKFLVDADGFVRFDHIGEGAYEETEHVIQELLRERDAKVQLEEGMVASEIKEIVDPSRIGTPELYLGYYRARQNPGNQSFKPDETISYTFPADGNFRPNYFYFEGTWENAAEYAELESDTGKIQLTYTAKVVNMVLGMPAKLTVYLDGRIPTPEEAGSDVVFEDGKAVVRVSEEKLYSLVDDSDYYTKTLLVEVEGKGLQAYTYTFG